MFDRFKRFVKSNQVNEATITPEQQVQAPAQVRPGSEVNRPVARPATARPARPAAKDASYDDFLEKEVGEKLAHEKAEADRLDEAISENEEQLKLLLGNLTEEEAKDPGVQKLLERLGNDGAKLKKQRTENPAPAKAAPKEPPKATKEAKATEEAKATVTAPLNAWTIDEITLCRSVESGNTVVYGWKEAFVVMIDVERSQTNVELYAVVADEDALGRKHLLPIGDPIKTLYDHCRRLPEENLPIIPSDITKLRQYAAFGMCKVETNGSETIYRGIPVVFRPAKSGSKRWWILNPITWALGAATVKELLCSERVLCKVDFIVEDEAITCAIRDERKNMLDGDYC